MADPIHYRTPPIAEAVLEVIVDPPITWTLESVAHLYDQLRLTHPAEPRHLLGSGVEVTANEKEGTALVRVAPADLIYEFASKDRRDLIRIGRGVVSVHVLAPYPGWDTFRQQIRTGLTAFVAFARPRVIKRIGIRYINKVDLGVASAELDDYFTISVDVPEDRGYSLGSFFVRTEARYEDSSIKLVRTFASAPSESVVAALDIDLIDESTFEIETIDSLLDRITHLRSLEREVFEASITDRLRSMFGVQE